VSRFAKMRSGDKANDSVSGPVIDCVPQGVERVGPLSGDDGTRAAEKICAPPGALFWCPLSTVPVPPAILARHMGVALTASSPVIQVMGGADADQMERSAHGEETLVEMEIEGGDETIPWQECCLIVPSIDASLAVQSQRLERLLHTYGIPALTSRDQVKGQVLPIRSSMHVEGVLEVSAQEATLRAMNVPGWQVETTQLSATLRCAISGNADLADRACGRRNGHPRPVGLLDVHHDDDRVSLRRFVIIALQVITVLFGYGSP